MRYHRPKPLSSHRARLEKATVDQIVSAMDRAGMEPALIYATEKTELLLTEENRHTFSEAELAAWNAAIAEYRAMEVPA